MHLKMADSGKVNSIAVVGAGLVGSLAAIYLAKRGYKVSVYERRGDLRKSELKGGRSINLALSNRGWLPLQQAGVLDDVEKMIVPMKGRTMHGLDSTTTFQPYGQEGQAINSISRSGLNEVLINKAEKIGAQFHFGHQCLKVDIESTSVILDSKDQKKHFEHDIIIGADGAFSAVRAAFQKTDRFDYSQSYIPHGYKELQIPPGKNGSFLMEKNTLHIWPRGNFMLIALPNKDGSFTVTLFLPFEGENSFNALSDIRKVNQFFEEQFPDALPLLSELDKDWLENPTSSLLTVRSYPWYKNRTLLIGDAAHAVVPFYGQGMNCGFEDCRVLNDMLQQSNDNWKRVLPDYQLSRKPDADAIADLALQNFIEMRDLVGDEHFLLRKKIEARLQELFPDKWIPQYSMVTFNENLRYSEAHELGKRQERIMDEVMKQKNISNNWGKLDYQGIIDRLSG
jgi:kynurenine 3-monooxygenase